MKQVIALLKKDLLLEFRQKHTFFGIVLYIMSTVFVLYLAIPETNAIIWNSLFWVIQLFVCVNAVAKSFLAESKGRMLYYYSIASPTQFIVSKLLYNIILMAVMGLLSLLLFRVFLSNPSVTVNSSLFILITLLGGISISMVFTLMSAIAAKAQNNAALMAVLGFPVILPLLMLLMKLSKTAFGEVFREGAVLQLCLQLAGLDVLVIAMSILLFPYLWKE